MIYHKHDFSNEEKNQLATWSKRGSDDIDAIYFRGTLWQCSCGAYRFQPDDRRLREVEVTI